MIAREVPRDVVRVTGPEATAYLQGQLSQDVEGLGVGASAQSLLLEPTGKLGLVLRITRQADHDFLLDVPAGWGDALGARLQRFKLRTKADIERLDGWRCLAVRGDGNGATGAAGAGSGWPTWPGDDLLGPDPQPPDGARPVDAEEWTRSRILAGVPELGCELAEGMIPAEGGRVLIDATVSFTKGCYTGQELVARVDSRGGNVPRRVLGLRLTEPAPPGATVGERGTITSAAGDVALALVPRGSAAGDTVAVTWDGGRAEATLVDLPFEP